LIKKNAKKNSIERKKMEDGIKKINSALLLNSTQQVNFKTFWPDYLSSLSLKLINMLVVFRWPSWLDMFRDKLYDR